MMTTLAWSLAYAGLAGLCLAMHRYQRQVWRRGVGSAASVGLRLAGWLCLTLSLATCTAVWGGVIGPVAWFGVLSATGLALVCLLPYAPRIAAALALIAPVVTATSVFVG